MWCCSTQHEKSSCVPRVVSCRFNPHYLVFRERTFKESRIIDIGQSFFGVQSCQIGFHVYATHTRVHSFFFFAASFIYSHSIWSFFFISVWKMVFNYWSVYALLVFLLKRNPALRRRWPRCKLHLLRSMPRNIALWKLRGVLFAATEEDIAHADAHGLFWSRDLLDSIVRVLRGRNWHRLPRFTSIFQRRGEYDFYKQ